MADVAPELLDRVRSICLGLPETYEEPAWIGVRWKVRQRTFAHVFAVDDASTSIMKEIMHLQGETTAVTFRVPAEDLLALRAAGHPFYYAGWGRNAMCLHLDDTTDWSEVAELMTESYCLLAPQKLVARVDRPSGSD
jgi:hypothetical protein